MAPTLQVGDTVAVDKFSYRVGGPKVGDIVVYYKDGTGFIKRLIAVGGQEIFFENDKVFRDGILVDEPYLAQGTPTRGERCTRQAPCVIPQGKVFVMGDNRTNSQDSRAGEVGYIEQDAIVGRALAVLYPLNRFGGL